MNGQETERIERDSMGEKKVPAGTYYGIQTVRACENFPISGIKCHKDFILSTVMVKKASAQANMICGKLSKEIGDAVIKASDEILEGRLHDQFVVDIIQAGAGTSHNMNTNEVLANRAIEILGGNKGDYKKVHPNDHVNMSQSTNDVIPTSIKIAALLLHKKLSPVLNEFTSALREKGNEFYGIIKSGRTHLQDAVPVRLGQEFNAYGTAAAKAAEKINEAAFRLEYLGIGGSATGTGINTAPDYKKIIVEELKKVTGLPLKISPDTFEAMQSMGDLAGLSSALRLFCIELIRISNDLRLLSSGPRTGLAEIILPPLQPGSSIMPGKVNPVMPEAMNMIGFHIIGNDTAIALAAQAGQMELNVMMPIIGYNLLQSLEILTNGVKVFTEKCIKGIKADEKRCKDYFEQSVGLATILNPYIGYEAAASVAKESAITGKSLKELILEKKLISPDKLNEILKAENIT